MEKKQQSGDVKVEEPETSTSVCRDHRLMGRIFLVVAFVVLLMPLVGMAWASTQTTTENRTLASAPVFVDEQGVNVDFLSEAGAYFEDHFAFRNNLVSANARLHAALGVSATDQVVVGENGWLYYAGTSFDYVGQSRLSDRALRSIAHNLSMLQGYAQASGASFSFTIAPNKNSLYSANMPLYYLRDASASNAQRLKPYLNEYGVRYVDMFALFEAQEDTLYYQRDSHWNNEGAFLASNALLESARKQPLVDGTETWITRDDFTGDLAGMLYPADPGTELNSYLVGVNDAEGQTGNTWSFDDDAHDVTANWVHTRSAGQGTLLMYRDSFANNLIPYLSTAYESAYFSKLIPYDATRIGAVRADAVVVERAERHLAYLAYTPPLMASPRVNVTLPTTDDADATDTTCTISTDGSYHVISGVIDPRLCGASTDVIVQVSDAEGTTRTMEAFCTTVLSDGASVDASGGGPSDSDANDYGYVVYFDKNTIGEVETVQVCVRDASGLHGMRTIDRNEIVDGE